jgi:mannitol-specific phosphotransferase system IIBC component
MAGSAVIAAAVVVGSAVSFVGQRQQAKAAQKRAREAAAERARAKKLKKRRADIQAARQRRRASAEARRFRAQAVNLAANRGAGGAIGAPGSTIPATTANLQSQLNYNNAFINRVTDINQGIRTALGNAQDIASRPITAGMGLMAFGGAIKGVGGAFAGADIKSAFNSPTGGATAAKYTATGPGQLNSRF